MGTLGDGDTAPASGPDAKKDDIYENRPGSKKIIRVVTVMAYMVSVSFVAIVLSAYYVFLWQPPNPRLMHRSHLRGDPQVDYLMDRPPTEVTLDEKFDADDLRKKVNIFREEIIKNRGINISKNFQPEVTMNNISRGNLTNLKNDPRNNSRIIVTSLNPIVRAILATTEIPKSEETLSNSTGVYDRISTNVSAETIEASTLFTTRKEVSKSIGMPFSSSSSSTLIEDTLYKDELNKFTTAMPISVEDIEKRKLKNSTGKGVEESIQRSKDLLESSSDKNVGLHSISREETTSRMMTSGTSSIFAIKPEMLRMTEKSAGKPEMLWTPKTPEMLQMTKKSVEKPEMVRITEKSVEKPEMLRITEKSTEEPEMLRITEKSAKKPEMVRTTEKSETIRTTEKSIEQQEYRKPLNIVAQPTELASHTARELAKFPTNETENLENFSSSQQANDEVSVEILPDSPGLEDPLVKSSISMIPAIIQPESEYLEKEEQSTQNSDFGFV